MVNSKSLSTVAIKAVADIADATIFSLSRALRGHLHFAAGGSVTTVTFYGCRTQNGTYSKIQDTSGADITITGVDGSAGIYALPAGVLGCPFVKLVGNVAGSCGVTMDADSAKA